MDTEIKSMVIDVVQEINDSLEQPVKLNFDEDILLFGQNGIFDSLALVTSVVAIEERIQEQYGVDVLLADEKAMSSRRSPFRSVSTLVDYIKIQVEAEMNNAH